MKFYKSVNRNHPTHVLPTVLWNPRADKPVFEFRRGPSGALEFETENPEIIDLLLSAGYGHEPDPGDAPTFSGMSLMHGVGPDHPDYAEIKTVEARNTRRTK